MRRGRHTRVDHQIRGRGGLRHLSQEVGDVTLYAAVGRIGAGCLNVEDQHVFRGQTALCLHHIHEVGCFLHTGVAGVAIVVSATDQTSARNALPVGGELRVRVTCSLAGLGKCKRGACSLNRRPRHGALRAADIRAPGEAGGGSGRHVHEHLREVAHVGGSPSGGCVPSHGSIEALHRESGSLRSIEKQGKGASHLIWASILLTCTVVAGHNVLEQLGDGGIGVEKRIDEADGRLAVVESPVVEQRDDAVPQRGACRGTVNAAGASVHRCVTGIKQGSITLVSHYPAANCEIKQALQATKKHGLLQTHV